MQIPSAYQDGMARARRIDPALTETYLRHTMIGDPLADAVMAAFRDVPAPVQRDWMHRGMDGGPMAVADAPAAWRDFLAETERVPDWFDPGFTGPGCRAFHGNSEMLIAAFVGAVLVEGFSTLISKSFSITGRLVDQGVRRLKQNNRHISEIFLPGGLDRHGDGWKMSVRIRLMHARLRVLLATAEEWDPPAWGVPLSSAHIAFATAAFSGGLLDRARKLGVEPTEDERRSFMMIWRYSGHLMGVAPELQAVDEAAAMRLFRLGMAAEPPPDLEAILLANGLINSAPVVAGITDAGQRRKLVRLIYSVSRGMIGDQLADALNYPPARNFGALAALRLRNRADRVLRRHVPAWDRRRRAFQFAQMIDLSFSDGAGNDYRMPAHLHAEKDRPS